MEDGKLQARIQFASVITLAEAIGGKPLNFIDSYSFLFTEKEIQKLKQEENLRRLYSIFGVPPDRQGDGK